MLVHVVQIKTDRGHYVDYCPIPSQSTFEFLDKNAALKRMGETQRATRRNHFQYRVVSRDKLEQKSLY